MKKEITKDLADVNLISFLEIKPSDVLFSKSLIHKLLGGEETKQYDEFFLWAQSAGAFTDVWLQDEVHDDPHENDNSDNSTSDKSLPPHLKVVAYLPAKDAEWCWEAWKGKRVNIPLTAEDFTKNKSDSPGKTRFRYLYKASLSTLGDINYFDKQCLVLRAHDKLKVHPMAIAYFIVDAIQSTSQVFKSIDQIIDFILCLKIDTEAMNDFHKSHADNYQNGVKYRYKSIVIKDCTDMWKAALKIVSAPVVTLSYLEKPFRRMGIEYWPTADILKDLNNNLGALFLTSIEFESFVKSGGNCFEDYFPINDQEYFENWLKKTNVERGVFTLKAFYEAIYLLSTELVHFNSSPIKRVFSHKLLKVLPKIEVILKQSENILHKEFFNEHGSDIDRGKRVLAGVTKSGKQKAIDSKIVIESKLPDARKLIIKRHKEYPSMSFTQICDKIAKEIGVGASTLKKYGVTKNSFADWVIHPKNSSCASR